MQESKFASLFTPKQLAALFPAERADQFFDALYGDAADGAYDITLHYAGSSNDGILNFELHLSERPGKCLACNLTYGLPEVFSRHPLINLKGLVQEIGTLLGEAGNCTGWKLGTTRQVKKSLHVVPLQVEFAAAN